MPPQLDLAASGGVTASASANVTIPASDGQRALVVSFMREGSTPDVRVPTFDGVAPDIQINDTIADGNGSDGGLYIWWDASLPADAGTYVLEGFRTDGATHWQVVTGARQSTVDHGLQTHAAADVVDGGYWIDLDVTEAGALILLCAEMGDDGSNPTNTGAGTIISEAYAGYIGGNPMVSSYGIEAATGTIRYTQSFDGTSRGIVSGVALVSPPPPPPAVPAGPTRVEVATREQWATLLRARHHSVEPQLYLLDGQLDRVEDLTPRLVERLQVKRRTFADIHGTVRLGLAGAIDWGRQYVQPVVRISGLADNGDLYVGERALGVFQLTIPSHPRSQGVPVYDCSGFDLGHKLSRPLPDAYTVAADQPVLFHVVQLLQQQGYPAHRISPAASGVLMGSDLSWPTTDETHVSVVINTLLDKAGYRGIYMDPETGLPRSERYLRPTETPLAWSYVAGERGTLVQLAGERQVDITDVPNRWVFATGADRDDPPVESDGIWTFTNQSVGPASVDARGGDVVTHKEQLEVETQEELVQAGRKRVDAMMLGAVTLELRTVVNPLHGHADVLDITDGQLGALGRWQHVAWTIDAFEHQMTHELRQVMTDDQAELVSL